MPSGVVVPAFCHPASLGRLWPLGWRGVHAFWSLSVVSVRRGLCVSDSSVSSVLSTSKPVTLACTGVGSAALERVSARYSEVPFLYLMVKRYLCSLISIFCSRAGALCRGFLQMVSSGWWSV